MRTLTVHTADDLATRWKRMAVLMDAEANTTELGTSAVSMRAVAQCYRVCASELHALVAVAMEQEAIHHGSPE